MNLDTELKTILRCVAVLIGLLGTPLLYGAGTFTCLQVYDGDDVYCYPLNGDSWRCEVIPTYRPQCIGSSTVDGAYPTLPERTAGGSGMPPGYVPPVYVDPAWLDVSSIDDTSPENIGVWVSAEPSLDNFQAFCNAAPCGTGFGQSTILVNGIDASEFNGEAVAIDVEGCASMGEVCAAARTRSYVAEKTAFGESTITVFTLERDDDNGEVGPALETYDRSIVSTFKDRSWEIPVYPGNARFTFGRVATSLTYRVNPGSETGINRLETLYSQIAPSSFASMCEMTSAPDIDTLLPPNSAVEWLQCSEDGRIAGSATFEGKISWLWKSGPAGVTGMGVLAAPVLRVTVP